jgi:hypothetical protein
MRRLEMLRLPTITPAPTTTLESTYLNRLKQGLPMLSKRRQRHSFLHVADPDDAQRPGDASVRKERSRTPDTGKKQTWRDSSGMLNLLVSRDCCDSDWIDDAATIVEEYEKNRPGPLVSVCDFMQVRMDWNLCFSELESYWEAKHAAEIDAVAATLSAPAKAALDQVRKTFEEFKTADGAWEIAETYDQGRDGPFVDAQQEIFDVTHFASLVMKIVKRHGLKPHTAAEFQAKDDELNFVHRHRVNAAISGWEEQLADQDFKDHWPDLRQQKAEYPESAKKAQRLWIRLQEPWKKLCEELYPGEMAPEEIDRAIETELREIRIQEIKGDPQYDPFKTEMP